MPSIMKKLFSPIQHNKASFYPPSVSNSIAVPALSDALPLSQRCSGVVSVSISTGVKALFPPPSDSRTIGYSVLPLVWRLTFCCLCRRWRGVSRHAAMTPVLTHKYGQPTVYINTLSTEISIGRKTRQEGEGRGAEITGSWGGAGLFARLVCWWSAPLPRWDFPGGTGGAGSHPASCGI